MHLEPVRRYRKPRFPTGSALDAHADLRHLVPRRWRGNRIVVAALAAGCGVALGGCRASMALAGGGASAKVAPIFEHGAGFGAWAGRTATSTGFITEGEAYRVIAEEARAAGISFKARALVLPEVRMPLTDNEAREHRVDGEWRPREPQKTDVRPLELDGTDPERRISFEFVSSTDFGEWKAPPGAEPARREEPIVACTDTKTTAETLRDGLARAKTDQTVAVFYDPIVSKGWRKLEDRARAAKEAATEAKTELRKQVRDFVEWLKAEGVI